jgi:uncharacterized membrane protein
MTLSTLGTIHIAAALMALVLGLSVFPATKGAPFHRAMGAGYVVGMVVLNVTALGLYRLTGHFNAFHVLALVSLASIAAGLWPLIARKPGWMTAHLRFMIGSYSGLWAATAAEALSRLPAARSFFDSPQAIISSSLAIGVIFLVVAVVVNRRVNWPEPVR